MTPAFERHGDVVRMQVTGKELDLLRRLRDEMRDLLTGAREGDPVTERLFPPAVTGDDEADSDLRGMIHDDLLESRLAALDDLLAVLDRAERRRRLHTVDLRDDEPAMVLGVLNDLRLALGARVGLATVELRELVADESSHASLALMDWFAMWQEQLLVALDPMAARHYDEPHDDPDETH